MSCVNHILIEIWMSYSNFYPQYFPSSHDYRASSNHFVLLNLKYFKNVPREDLRLQRIIFHVLNTTKSITRILENISPLHFPKVCKEIKYSLFLSRGCHHYYIDKRSEIKLIFRKKLFQNILRLFNYFLFRNIKICSGQVCTS